MIRLESQHLLCVEGLLHAVIYFRVVVFEWNELLQTDGLDFIGASNQLGRVRTLLFKRPLILLLLVFQDLVSLLNKLLDLTVKLSSYGDDRLLMGTLVSMKGSFKGLSLERVC